MSDIEIMEFPYGAFLKVRLEFVLLRDNELEAKIMRIVEGWMIDQKKAWMNACAQAASDGKTEPPEPDYYVTLSYAQIIAQLYMFNSSRKGENKEVVGGKDNSISRRTVSKAVQALVDDKIFFTRPNPNPTKEYDAAQYTLNCSLVQEQMKRLPRNPMSYLGNNGRIDGRPCENFAHPPCENNSHPMQNNFTSPCENNAGGDVQNFHHLIDISNRDTNREKERTSAPTVAISQPDSFTHSSTPSLSLVDNSGDNQASSEQDDTPHHIANPTIENVESLTTRNTVPATNARRTDELDPANLINLLSEDELRIHGYWLDLGFDADVTPTLKTHWSKLVRHIASFEQMEGLYKYARLHLVNAKDPTVHPGNMAKFATAWKQKQAPPPEPPKPSQQGRPKSLAELNAEKMKYAGVTARK